MSTPPLESLPVAVIGGGPLGLAAAAHLVARNLPVKLYEAGPAVGTNLRDWGDVRVFTPWRYCVDATAVALLKRTGWRAPPADVFPIGSEIVARYLEPLAATPELAAAIETGARVTAISRLGLDKVASRARARRPFELVIETSGGRRRDLARAVIDASGTWATPNPLGANGLSAEGETAEGSPHIGPVDRIIVATGQRPDLSLTRELRLALDPSLESAKALGPLIDPNEHSCGSVPPHGHRELAHPEPGFYTAGIKSYGRAPTFLLLTGYEQVRSIAAALAGDRTASDSVHLVLPKTGVCTTTFPVEADSAAGCCGGPAPIGADACCVADAVAKEAGKKGCGCGAGA